MRTLALALVFAGACGASQKPAAAPASPLHAGLNIKHTAIYVDDQDKALAFYTDVLGFAKKDDVTNGPFRWLTVTAPEDRDGTELQLAPNGDPATLAYQQSLHDQGQPAAMFFTADVEADYERIKTNGAVFTMPPTDVVFATIAVLDDTCGNLVQLTELK